MKPRISVHDQNGGSFWASTVEQAIEQAGEYANDQDVFRVYQIDEDNPWPGFMVCWVTKADVMKRDGRPFAMFRFKGVTVSMTQSQFDHCVRDSRDCCGNAADCLNCRAAEYAGANNYHAGSESPSLQ